MPPSEDIADLKPELLRAFGHHEIRMFAIRAKTPSLAEELCNSLDKEALARFL